MGKTKMKRMATFRHLICDVCGKHKRGVEIKPIQLEALYICESCLRKALKLIEEGEKCSATEI